ncbi:MAG: hypothetical protein ABIH41_06490 [Nanoarchaeota archaeon]
MSIDIHTLKDVAELDFAVHDNAEDYHHGRELTTSDSGIVLPSKRRHSITFSYDLKDLLLIGALTESPVLLTGGTDLGKTSIAKLVMNALFGKHDEGWHRLDFDNDFGKDAYTNVNFDAFQKEGMTTQDLYSAQPWLRLPGFIADELNRAHAKISTKALHIIREKEITLPDGSRVQIGHPLAEGGTYQFQIATINEGSDYSGTFDLDRALRRRTTIEIPLDVFMPTPRDRKRILESGQEDIPMRNTQSRLEAVLQANHDVHTIQLHPNAQLFISYLEAFDYCKNSLTGEKGSVAARQGSIEHICTKPRRNSADLLADGAGCEYLRTFEDNLCPYVRGITPGISKNLVTVAKGFAALRAVKFAEALSGFAQGKRHRDLSYTIHTPDQFERSLQEYAGTSETGEALAHRALETYTATLEVELEDVQSAFGFVAYSKIGIALQWIGKHYQGNRFAAVNYFLQSAKTKFEEGLAAPALTTLAATLNGGATTEGIEAIKRHCETNNPWLWRVLDPHLNGANQSTDREQFYRLLDRP